MPKSKYKIFLCLLFGVVLFLCIYIRHIDENVNFKFGARSLDFSDGSNLRNLRSSSGERLTATGVTPTNFSVQSQQGESDKQNTTSFHYRTVNVEDSSLNLINVAFIFCNVGQQPALKLNLQRMLHSLVEHCPGNSTAICFHVVTDSDGWLLVKDMILLEASSYNVAVQVCAHFPRSLSLSQC